jgi:hypothetical protein
MTTPPTTPANWTLVAVTDKLCTRWHLGAVEKGNVTFCGVKLKDDPAIAEAEADGKNRYQVSIDLGEVGCGACKRTAIWKTQGPDAPPAVAETPAPPADQLKPVTSLTATQKAARELDARVLANLRTLPAGTGRTLEDVLAGLENTTKAGLRASLKRLVKAGDATAEGDLYQAAKVAE